MNNSINQFAMIKEDTLSEMISSLERIERKLDTNSKTNAALGDYITEKEAMKILNRKTTWFFNKRTSGELKGKKAGNVWYYKINDIKKFIDNGISS